jgi:GTP-binding protein LepA
VVSQSSLDGQEIMTYTFPMSEIITDFFDMIKSLTKGYGSLEYHFVGFRRAEVEKLVIYIMDEPVDALSFMVRAERAFQIGKQICVKLKDKIPPELFVVAI